MNRNIELLIRPRSIAVIGASAKPGKMGNVLVRNLLRSSAEIYPINPHEKIIEGLRCYESISDLKPAVDLAIISLPAESTPAEVKKAAEKEIPFVIITTAGFSEMGDAGRKIEKEMAEHAIARGTRILGPNTLGVYSPTTNLDTLIIPTERSPRPGKGCIGMISQSGSVQVSMQERAEAMGIGISHSVGLGNRSDISEIDLLEFLEKDPDTKCIAIYLESFHDGKRFLEIASRISPNKPVVAIKAGATEAGSRAASSHTGALSKGSDAIVDGALKQAGVIRAHDDEELVDYSNAFSLMPCPAGNRIAYVGSAGGVGVMISDYVEGDKFEPASKMTRLSNRTKESLHKILYEFAPVSNPVDLTASSTPTQYDGAMKLVLGDSSVDMVILSIDLQPPMMSDSIFEFIPDWIKFGKPIVGTSTGGGRVAQKAILKMQSCGIPSYLSLSRCVKAAKALYQRSLFLKRVM